MAAVTALRLEDPEGSVMVVTRIDDLVYTLSVEYAGPQPFRLFEDDRSKLREFLRALDG